MGLIGFLALVGLIAAFIIAAVLGQQKAPSTRSSKNTDGTADATAYFDAFFALSQRLAHSIPLADWGKEIPDSYTLRESVCIDKMHRARQTLEFTTASRFVEDPLQRIVTEMGLLLAARELRAEEAESWRDEHPIDNVDASDTQVENLEEIVSSYLKAWLPNSNPFILAELAEFLAGQRRPSEAKESLEAAWCYQGYARSHRPSDYEKAAHLIAFELILSGGFELFNDLSLPEVETRLAARAKRVHEKLDALKAPSEAHVGSSATPVISQSQRSSEETPLSDAYPSPERISEFLDAWKKEGRGGILNVIQGRPKT
jgi:hypothetical protein